MISDTAWGIERDRDSDAFGELVCPVIMLWSEPGGTDVEDGADLTGAVSHNENVYITHELEIEGSRWCRVECFIWHEGEVYPQKGWLRASLLKEAGVNENV